MRRAAGLLSALVALVAAGAAAAGAAAAGSIRIGVQLEPPVLDPTANPAAAISAVLYDNVYEGLVEFTADGSVRPRLAESWVITDDGLTYTFKLRSGVRFHDGVMFDAATAKFSLDRARAAGSVNPQRSRLEAIDSVEVLDTDTLRIRLKQRSSGLLQSLAFGAFVMVEPKSAGSNAQRPVGTGPFRFAQWRRGDSLRLEWNCDYWGKAGAPQPGGVPLDAATFRFISDPTAAYAALMAGDIDAFDNYPAPESFAQFAADPRFAVFVGPSEGETILSLNNRRPPLNDLRVRRAVSYALDRRAIIDGAMFGYGTPIGSHFPPRNPAYVDLTGRYPHDVSAARRLLAVAGYATGFDVTLKLPPPSYARRSGEIIAAQLAVVGIRAHIENLEWSQWIEQVYTRHDFDMSIVAHVEPLDYDIYARDDYYFGYSSPEFKALIAALDDATDAGERRGLLERIQRKLADDAVNGFLFQYPRLAVWNKHFSGVGFDNVLGTVDLGHARYVGPPPAAQGPQVAVREWHALGWAAAALALLVLLLAARRMGLRFLGGRLGVLLGTTWAATVIVFVIVQVLPGDPVRTMMGMQADPAAMSVLKAQLGLDAGPLQRYFRWLAGLVHGDFGVSYTYRVPVGSLIAERLPVSLPLAVYALALAILMAFPAGLVAAARRGRPADALLTGVTQVGLAVNLHWVAAGGFPGWGAGFWTALAALTLPAVALAMPQAAILARVLRGALLDTLHEDYIRTARAKGAGEWQVLWRHALPNAMPPVLTVLGLQFGFLLAGAVIIENVFFLPGLGRLAFQAIVQRDLMVVQSVVVLLVAAVVSLSFLVDVGAGCIDPRLRSGGNA
jgi:ABC-type transport system substrate-binding protein/ABC-type dipeptide/oligopeptide/nickel transport system permease component